MRSFLFAIATAGVLAGATLVSGRAEAMPLDAASALRGAAEKLNVVDNVQFVYGGRRYCWYDAGWRGGGWYWCGYAWRRGLGWGGPVGWRGWRWHTWRPHRVHRGRVIHRGRVHIQRGNVHRGGRAVHRRGRR